jgi:hypothetical protein
MADRFHIHGVSDIFVNQGSGGGSNVPAPPVYNAELVTRGGVLMWRQHEETVATFVNAFQANAVWPTFGLRPFLVSANEPVVTVGDKEVTLEITNVTPTGCTITLSDNITGTVTVNVWENI